MPDAGRLVEVRAVSEGSGFLIADCLVITALHLFRSRTGDPPLPDAKVRIQRDIDSGLSLEAATRAAQLIWPLGYDPGSNLDFALLKVIPNASTPSGKCSPPDTTVPWTPLAGWGRLEVEAVGYPDLAIDPALDRRDTKTVAGWIMTTDNARGMAEGRGTLDLRISDEDTPHIPPAEAWPAMSGAAAFAGEAVVGIIRVAGAQADRHQLRVLPIERLFTRQDVAQALMQAGIRPPRRIDLLRSSGLPREDTNANPPPDHGT